MAEIVAIAYSSGTTTGRTVPVTTSTPLPIISGVGALDLGKAEDAAHTSGDVGVMALGVRNDSNATLASTDLDYGPFKVDATGAVAVIGQRAHDAAVGGLPLIAGGRASAALPTAVSDDGDAVWAWMSKLGAQVIAGSGALAAQTVPTTAAGIARVDNNTTVPLAVQQTAWSFSRITTATTTVVKASAGVLHALTIPVATTGAVTVYDNTSAAGTILTVAPIGTVGTLFYDTGMATGITVVTAAADEVTAVYR